MTQETIARYGEAFELGEQLTVVGRKLEVGDTAPDVPLETLDSATGAVRTVRPSDWAGKIRLLNIVNSLDTPVCDVETRRWDAARTGLSPDVEILTISMDLPFAQARWCGAARTGHPALSAHKSEDFGCAYGVLLKEWRLLQRTVLILDRHGVVTYVEYVADQMAEPNYAAALAAARRLA